MSVIIQLFILRKASIFFRASTATLFEIEQCLYDFIPQEQETNQQKKHTKKETKQSNERQIHSILCVGNTDRKDKCKSKEEKREANVKGDMNREANEAGIKTQRE